MSLITLSLILSFVLVIKVLLLRILRTDYSLAKKLNGPKLYPIVGAYFMFPMTTIQLFEYFRKCARLYNKSVYRFWNMGSIHIQASHAREAEILAKSKRRKPVIYKVLTGLMGRGVILANGERWMKHRRMLKPAFCTENINSFCTIIEEQSKKMANELRRKVDQGDCVQDVIKLASDKTLDVVCQAIMGVNPEDLTQLEEYQRNLHRLSHIVSERMAKVYLQFKSVYKFSGLKAKEQRILAPIHELTQEVIDKRKVLLQADPQTPYAMIDTLLENEKDLKINSQDVREEVDTLIAAGYDTTTAAFGFMLFALGTHQDVQEKVYQEICKVLPSSGGDEALSLDKLSKLDYLDRVIMECMRLYPPIPQVSRKVQEDLHVDGDTVIPKGTPIHLQIYDLHRDEDQFPEPEKFDPDRFLPENIAKRHKFAYLPFFAGPRSCPGQRFATLQIKIAVIYVMMEFKLTALTKSDELLFRVDVVLRSLKPVFVEFKKRNDNAKFMQ